MHRSYERERGEMGEEEEESVARENENDYEERERFFNRPETITSSGNRPLRPLLRSKHLAQHHLLNQIAKRVIAVLGRREDAVDRGAIKWLDSTAACVAK